jgi:hypothetical protein
MIRLPSDKPYVKSLSQCPCFNPTCTYNMGLGQTRPGLNRVRASRSNWQNYLAFRIAVGQGAGSRDPVLTGCGSERVKGLMATSVTKIGTQKLHKTLRLSKPTDVTIHLKVIEEPSP